MTQRRATNPTPRRATIILASVSAVALLGSAAQATPFEGKYREVDQPSGFAAEILAPHSAFPDEVRAGFRLRYDDGGGTVVSNLPRDAGTVVQARVTWQPGGTSGWHTHPGPVVVTVTEGEVEVTNARDCETRTYEAGEAFLDPGQGNVHIATNPDDSDDAVAYATFFGVPDGEPATAWVKPVDC